MRLKIGTWLIKKVLYLLESLLFGLFVYRSLGVRNPDIGILSLINQHVRPVIRLAMHRGIQILQLLTLTADRDVVMIESAGAQCRRPLIKIASFLHQHLIKVIGCLR